MALRRRPCWCRPCRSSTWRWDGRSWPARNDPRAGEASQAIIGSESRRRLGETAMRYYFVGWLGLFLLLALTTSPVAAQETRRSASSEDLRELEERAGDFLRDFRGTTGPERALRSFVEDSTLADR